MGERERKKVLMLKKISWDFATKHFWQDISKNIKNILHVLLGT